MTTEKNIKLKRLYTTREIQQSLNFSSQRMGQTNVEEVQIDEEIELEYSYITAHNEVVKAAYLYHFENVTLKAVLHFPRLVSSIFM